MQNVNFRGAISNTNIQILSSREQSEIDVSRGIRRIWFSRLSHNPVIGGQTGHQKGDDNAIAKKCGENQATGFDAHVEVFRLPLGPFFVSRICCCLSC